METGCNRKIKNVRDTGLDKFYTIPIVVDMCLSNMETLCKLQEFDLVIEPSAGNGSFYNKIPIKNKIGLDISPEHPDLLKMDFFNYSPLNSYNNILVVGNPPFGKCSSLAIKFFNHSAKFCNIIAFILPRTFRRISVINKLDLNFSLLSDIDIPVVPCSFEPKMNVKCCFQIWKKIDGIKRQLISLPQFHQDWEFLPINNDGILKVPENADFALRAYGGKCGEITFDITNLRPKSWHFIKSNINIDTLVSNFNKLDYSISLNTARQNSIGKADLVKLYTDSFYSDNL